MARRYRGRNRYIPILGVHPYEAGMWFGTVLWIGKLAVKSWLAGLTRVGKHRADRVTKIGPVITGEIVGGTVYSRAGAR